MTQPIHPVLERVARQMYDKQPIASPIEGEQWSWDWLVTEKWTIVDTYRDLARAAIQALLEPDEGMEQAWQDAEDWDDHPAEAHFNIRRYQAMLKPLLGDEG